jgi:hypothetical protein
VNQTVLVDQVGDRPHIPRAAESHGEKFLGGAHIAHEMRQ